MLLITQMLLKMRKLAVAADRVIFLSAHVKEKRELVGRTGLEPVTFGS